MEDLKGLKWIDCYVTGLIEAYGTNDVYELYDCLRITINKLDPDNILLGGNEALYNRDFNNKEIVFIRNDLNRKYERFVLAHELAHAIIHTNSYIAAYDKTLLNQGKLERQAHYFALKLLNINPYNQYYMDYTIDQISCVLCIPSKYLTKVIG